MLSCLKTCHWLLCFSSGTFTKPFDPALLCSITFHVCKVALGKRDKSLSSLISGKNKQASKQTNRHRTVIKRFPSPGESQVCRGDRTSFCFCSALGTADWTAHIPCRKALENVVPPASPSFSTSLISPLSFSPSEGRELADYKCDLSHWVIVAQNGREAFAVLCFLVT